MNSIFILGGFELHYVLDVCNHPEAYEILISKRNRLIPWKDALFDIYEKIREDDPNFSKIQKAKDEDAIIGSYDGFYRKIHSVLDDIKVLPPLLGSITSITL